VHSKGDFSKDDPTPAVAKRPAKLNLSSNNIGRNSWVFLKVEMGSLHGYSLAQVSEVRGIEPLLAYKVLVDYFYLVTIITFKIRFEEEESDPKHVRAMAAVYKRCDLLASVRPVSFQVCLLLLM
jgi:hypothetical protein